MALRSIELEPFWRNSMVQATAVFVFGVGGSLGVPGSAHAFITSPENFSVVCGRSAFVASKGGAETAYRSYYQQAHSGDPDVLVENDCLDDHRRAQMSSATSIAMQAYEIQGFASPLGSRLAPGIYRPPLLEPFARIYVSPDADGIGSAVSPCRVDGTYDANRLSFVQFSQEALNNKSLGRSAKPHSPTRRSQTPGAGIA